jgi:hypothetical protein
MPPELTELRAALTPENLEAFRCVGIGILGMAFALKIREWWMRVGEGKCQYEFYDEKLGWQTCGKPAKHIHHVIPDGWTRDRGGDPDNNVGMSLCENHHVRNYNDEPYSYDSSFHPDMAQAYKEYHEWKMQHQHMEEITGHRIPRDSPFDEAAKEHRVKSKKGERYWSSTEEMDQYYEQKMRDKATSYISRTGDKKPEVHRRTK